MRKQDYYNDFFDFGQQKINFSFFKLCLPEDDPVYTLKKVGEVLDELNYQFLRRLKKEGMITLKELYIDGTKIEANANRDTFVWRGSINYHLAVCWIP